MNPEKTKSQVKLLHTENNHISLVNENYINNHTNLNPVGETKPNRKGDKVRKIYNHKKP